MTRGVAEISGVQVQLCRKGYLSDIIRFEGVTYVLPGLHVTQMEVRA